MKTMAQLQTDRSLHRSAAESNCPLREPNGSAILDNRPEAVAQRGLAETIYNGPFMVAQRRQLKSLFGETAQLKGGPEEEELLQKKVAPLQRRGPEDEELLQGKFEVRQRKGLEEEEPLQGKFEGMSSAQLKEEAPKPNDTGLPDNLKSGIESLSGLSMDNVNVHYNSSQPAQLNALAYTQGTDIHIAPGQEQHLPHEAWHVVQQAQGRVQPTMQLKDGVPVNDDQGLEQEADVMGANALQAKPNLYVSPLKKISGHDMVQRVISDADIEERLQEEIDGPGGFNTGGEAFHEFLKWQKSIRKLEDRYRTMGPEFEFAKLDFVEPIPPHQELAKSGETINGLPVVFETDAGNVVELACPPFVVSTSMDSWDKAQKRSMIITSKLEQTLKGIAESGVSQGMTLRGLMWAMENFFNMRLGLTKTEKLYKDTPLTSFTKGVADFTNQYFDKSHMSNAQINLKMSTGEVGAALQSGRRGWSSHMYLKNVVNQQLLNVLKPFWSPEEESTYRNRIAIISYYLSQIPVMSLQYIMNEVRRAVQHETKESPEKNRTEFRKSHPANALLLRKLSTIKDYMGFWIKASLNDMMMDDPAICEMILSLSQESIVGFMVDNTKKMWKGDREKMWAGYREGLKAYLSTFNGTLNDEAYENTVNSIVKNLFGLAKSVKEGKSSQPHKIDFPKYGGEGASEELIDYAGGAPFMARPDTYVPLTGGHLVEVRGLNRKIFPNKFMRGFQMPFFRKFGSLAGEKLAGEDTADMDIYAYVKYLKVESEESKKRKRKLANQNPNPKRMRPDQWEGSSNPINYVQGAPFTAWPDPAVSLTGGHLVEGRDLNKEMSSPWGAKNMEKSSSRFLQGSHIALDNEKLFESLAEELSLNQITIVLNGYQVGRLIELFGGNPNREIVTYNGVRLKVVQTPEGLGKTQYNPAGFSFSLVKQTLIGG